MSERDEASASLAANKDHTMEDKNNNTDEKLPEGPTDSHILSQVGQDEKALLQKASDTATTTDLGWNNTAVHFEEPLVAGLSNEDLWMLIRRFDKVSRHG